jgi:hypothetical protein
MSQRNPFRSLPYKLDRKRLARCTYVAIGLVLLGCIGGWLWYYNMVQPDITTQIIRGQVNYAGLFYQIERVEQSRRFLNDPYSDQNGMMRVFLRVENTTDQNISIAYSDTAHLVLSGGKSLSPVTLNMRALNKAHTIQAGYLDFSVPVEIRIPQLTFQLGRMDEAQVAVPLTGHADLRKYNEQKSALHVTLSYQGLNWTLDRAATTFGKDGQQAKEGMCYLTFVVSVDNPLSQMVIPGSPFEYMRLEAGNSSESLQESTLPVAFGAGTAGERGEVTFVIPQSSDQVTLRLLSLPQAGFAQARQTFSLKKMELL